jgi:cystathionine beta-lyase
MFVNPLNPNGRVFPKEDVKKLAELCLKYKKYLICDEIFADLVI